MQFIECKDNQNIRQLQILSQKSHFPITHTNSITNNRLTTPFFLHRLSIVSPSFLHRSSIETMDHRWSIDGVSMEYLRRKSGHIAVLLISEMPCIREGKSIDEKIPTSEPVGTNIIY